MNGCIATEREKWRSSRGIERESLGVGVQGSVDASNRHDGRVVESGNHLSDPTDTPSRANRTSVSGVIYQDDKI